MSLTSKALWKFLSKADCLSLHQEQGDVSALHISLHSGPNHFLHVQPLTDIRNTHEKTRKQMKETWAKECKRLTEGISVMQKSRVKYHQLSQEWERALSQRQREEESKYKLKLEKRNKEEVDLRTKVQRKAGGREKQYKRVQGSQTCNFYPFALFSLSHSMVDPCREARFGFTFCADTLTLFCGVREKPKTLKLDDSRRSYFQAVKLTNELIAQLDDFRQTVIHVICVRCMRNSQGCGNAEPHCGLECTEETS